MLGPLRCRIIRFPLYMQKLETAENQLPLQFWLLLRSVNDLQRAIIALIVVWPLLHNTNKQHDEVCKHFLFQSYQYRTWPHHIHHTCIPKFHISHTIYLTMADLTVQMSQHTLIHTSLSCNLPSFFSHTPPR